MKMKNWEQIKKLKKEDGQSTIEFILTMTMMVGFTLFFLQLSLAFAVGNYFHYATFMAARAYLSAGPDRSDQEQRARILGTEMVKQSIGTAGVDRWPGVAKGVGGGNPKGMEIGPGRQFDDGNISYSWQEGVRYTFRSPLFLGLFGGGESLEKFELTSESWLGREPSYRECLEDISARVPRLVIDNGC